MPWDPGDFARFKERVRENLFVKNGGEVSLKAEDLPSWFINPKKHPLTDLR